MKVRWMTGLTLLLLVAAPASPALAGGGGHACETQTEGTGNDVVIADVCFQPNLLHVEPGSRVEFLNKDPFGHNVYGTGWAVGELAANGGTGSASFADEGMYPFQCTLHPGMTGVIVVGDGDGAGNGAAVAVNVPDADPPAGTTTANTATDTADEDGTWLAAGIVGLLMGVAVGIAGMTLTTVSTRRRERLASASA